MLSNRLKSVARRQYEPPIVAAVAGNSFATASANVALPSGIEAGDLLLMFTWTIVGLFNEPSGWHEDSAQALPGFGSRMQSFLREADGTEGSSVVISRASSTGRDSYAFVYRITGWSGVAYPETQVSTTDAPMPEIYADRENLIICAVARNSNPSQFLGVPAGFVQNIVYNSGDPRFVAMRGLGGPGIVQPGAMQYSNDSDCLMISYSISGK